MILNLLIWEIYTKPHPLQDLQVFLELSHLLSTSAMHLVIMITGHYSHNIYHVDYPKFLFGLLSFFTRL